MLMSIDEEYAKSYFRLPIADFAYSSRNCVYKQCNRSSVHRGGSLKVTPGHNTRLVLHIFKSIYILNDWADNIYIILYSCG